MRASHRSRAALTTMFGVSLVALVAVGTASSLLGPAAAVVAAGTSDGGVVPVRYDSGTGGNVACAEITQIADAADLLSSGRIDRQGNGFKGDLPDGLEVTLTGQTFVSWTSTFPVAAVIMKGGDAAHVYVYAAPALGDAGLSSPPNASGNPANLSNITFCWDPDPGNGVDLQALCLDAAREAGVGDIVSFAGPVVIEDGLVVPATVPDGFLVTFDADADLVGFTAPFPVVVVVTAASDPVVHLIQPPSASGSVPLSGNPGDGELVFCGLDTPVVVAVSCADTGADAELGPVPIRDGVLDPADLPDGITSLDLAASIAIVATVPVVGVVVEASPPVLYVFPTAVLTGSVPVDVSEESDIDLVFCVQRLTDPTDPVQPIDPTTERPTSGEKTLTTTPETQVEAQVETPALSDPTEIATGGGPSGRTLPALLSFLILSVTGSSTLLLWARGG